MSTWFKAFVLLSGIIGAVVTFTKNAEKLSRLR